MASRQANDAVYSLHVNEAFLRVSKHVTESIRNIARGVGIN